MVLVNIACDSVNDSMVRLHLLVGCDYNEVYGFSVCSVLLAEKESTFLVFTLFGVVQKLSLNHFTAEFSLQYYADPEFLGITGGKIGFFGLAGLVLVFLSLLILCSPISWHFDRCSVADESVLLVFHPSNNCVLHDCSQTFL